jgi:hypothetical protein
VGYVSLNYGILSAEIKKIETKKESFMMDIKNHEGLNVGFYVLLVDRPCTSWAGQHVEKEGGGASSPAISTAILPRISNQRRH